jgi:hypothetical protein
MINLLVNAVLIVLLYVVIIMTTPSFLFSDVSLAY